jgi:hypothetical protein
MKQIENVEIYGLEQSIRASKFPMAVDVNKCTTDVKPMTRQLGRVATGTGHDNFLKGIVVQFDLTMTPKMSVELERYHFIDFVSSQSTMHRITKFDLDTAYIDYVDPRIIPIIKEKVDRYNTLQEKIKSVKDTNYLHKDFTKSLQDECTQLYLEILYSNPCGMKLTAGMTTNYRQLKTIYAQRKTHRLPEWRAFCEWIETLPMAELITG